MKLFLVALMACCLAVHAVRQYPDNYDEWKKLSHKYHEICCKQEHLEKDSDDMRRIKQHEVPITKQGQCYIACYLEQFDLTSNSQLLRDNVASLFKTSLSKEGAELMEDMKLEFLTCVDKIESMDRCDFGYSVRKCMRGQVAEDTSE